MKNYITIMKAYLKETYRLDKATSLRKKIGFVVGMCLCFAPIIGIMAFSIFQMAQIFIIEGRFANLISTLIFGSQMTTLFFTAYSFVSVMFLSKDNEIIEQLPVSKITKISAKYTLIYLTELLISSLVLLPMLISAGVAGVMSNAIGASYFLLIPILLIVSPFFPLLIISLIATPIMYIISFLKTHNALKIIISLGFLGCMLGLWMSFVKLMPEGNTDGMYLPASVINQIVLTSKIIYPNLFVAKAMLSSFASGALWLNLFLYLICFSAMLAVSFGVGILVYKKAITSSMEFSKKPKKKIKIAKTEQLSNKKALFVREFKDLIKNPTMLLSSLMGIIMAPVMLGFMSSMMRVENTTVSEAQNLINSLPMFVYLALILLCSTNYSSLIAISREGEYFMILKYLPINPVDVVKIKLYVADAINLLGSVVVAVVLIFTAKLQLLNAFIFATLITAFGMSINSFALYRDLKNPKLKWMNVKEITNKNLGAMMPMFLCLGVGFVFVILGTVLAQFYSKLGNWVYLIFWGVFAIIDAILFIVFRKKLYNNCADLFEKIEC
ncbi:MAG: hypothetical protein RR454_03235 [Clostridia bacterium]